MLQTLLQSSDYTERVTSVWGNFILSTATERTLASDVIVTLMRTMMMNSAVQFCALFTTSVTDGLLFLLPFYFFTFHPCFIGLERFTLTWLHSVGHHVLGSVHDVHVGLQCFVEGLDLM